MLITTSISALCFILALFCAAFLPYRSLKIGFGIFAFVYLSLLCFDFILLYAFDRHFGLFVVTFFQTSIKGAPFATFARELWGVSAILLAVVLLSIIITSRILNLNHKSKFSLLFAPLLLGAFALNPTYIAAQELYLNFYPPISKFKKHVYPYLSVPSPREPTKQKNIVYIFLESFDRAYTDERLFPGLTPNLNALKNRIDFTNTTQVRDTEFTIKGLFGAHCGANYTYVPRHELDDENFSKNIKCASEILREIGYYTYFMKGAPLSFQGTDRFLKARKYNEAKGMDEILSRYPSSKTSQHGQLTTNLWGIDDDETLRIAWDDFNRLAKTQKPFMLGFITLATHAPNGFIPKAVKIYATRKMTNPCFKPCIAPISSSVNLSVKSAIANTAKTPSSCYKTTTRYHTQEIYKV